MSKQNMDNDIEKNLAKYMYDHCDRLIARTMVQGIVGVGFVWLADGWIKKTCIGTMWIGLYGPQLYGLAKSKHNRSFATTHFQKNYWCMHGPTRIQKLVQKDVSKTVMADLAINLAAATVVGSASIPLLKGAFVFNVLNFKNNTYRPHTMTKEYDEGWYMLNEYCKFLNTNLFSWLQG